jgi:hypothetical protein
VSGSTSEFGEFTSAFFYLRISNIILPLLSEFLMSFGREKRRKIIKTCKANFASNVNKLSLVRNFIDFIARRGV